MSKKNKYVFISGGTSGIGKELVSLFLHNHINVITFSSRKKNVIKLKKDFSNYGDQLTCFQADITSEKDLNYIHKVIVGKTKRIDYLINNSGTNRIGPISKIKANEWNQIISVNLSGPFFLTQKLLGFLKKDSLVLNMGSIASRTGFPNWAAYCSSKFGLKGFTESLREELRPKKIRVVHAEIGATDTPIWDNLDGKWDKSGMMLDTEVAKVLFDSITNKSSVNVDEIFLMPPAGIL